MDAVIKAQNAKKEIGARKDALRLKIFEEFVPAKEILQKAQKTAHNKLNDMFEKWVDMSHEQRQLK